MTEQPAPDDLVERIVGALAGDERLLGRQERQLIRALSGRLAAAGDPRLREASMRALAETVTDVVGRRLVGGLARMVTERALASDRDDNLDVDKLLAPEPFDPFVNPPPVFPPDVLGPIGPSAPSVPHPPPDGPIGPFIPVPLDIPPFVVPSGPSGPGINIPAGPPLFPGGIPPLFPGGFPTPIPLFGAALAAAGEPAAHIGVVDDVVAVPELEQIMTLAREREDAFERVTDVSALGGGEQVARTARTLDVNELAQRLDEALAPALRQALGEAGLTAAGQVVDARLVALGPDEAHVLRPLEAVPAAVDFVIALSQPPPGAELRIHAALTVGETPVPVEGFLPIALGHGRAIVFPAAFTATLEPGYVSSGALDDCLLALVGRLGR